jgi:hypothetical protein
MKLTIDPAQVRHWCLYCPDLILEVEDAATHPDLGRDQIGEQGFAHVDCATANGHEVEGASQPDPADARYAIRQAVRERDQRDQRAANELADEALRGPWVATLSDLAGFIVDVNEGDDYDEVTIAVVRGSATPALDLQGESRMPATWDPADVLYVFDDFLSDHDVRARWVQAQAVAEALNARAVKEGVGR